MAKMVVALGGNALGKTPQEQLELVKDTAKAIVDLVKQGNQVIVTHGNGPQVGMINLAMETAPDVPNMPFPECGAMSQGYIGYHLQNAIRKELKENKMENEVATIVTQVIVDKDDNAFIEPTKPIGSFYTKDEAMDIANEKGYIFLEDAGRGWRRVVASPKPVDIVEKKIIKTLIDNENIVITVGGGGIPVIKKGNDLIGVPAVIDKDFASSKLAKIIDADYLVILTAVDKVSLNFNKENQIDLEKITVNQAKDYVDEGHFMEGSMLPKIEAAIRFAESKEGRRSLIASLSKAKEALEGNSGTLIYKD